MPPLTPFALAERRFAAVLFDLDGTLIDSIPSVERCWRRWCVEYGLDPGGFDGMHGVPAVQVIERLLPPELRAEGFTRIRDLEVADAGSVRLFPGALDLLDALSTAGAAHGFVTSGTADLAGARIAATGLPVATVLVTADQVARGKPEPDPYLEAARRLGVDPADCLVLEDAPAGAVSARAAGCVVLGVLTTTPQAQLEAVADLVVEGVASVTATVEPDGIRVLVRG